jgi:hypothetical protein
MGIVYNQHDGLVDSGCACFLPIVFEAVQHGHICIVKTIRISMDLLDSQPNSSHPNSETVPLQTGSRQLHQDNVLMIS